MKGSGQTERQGEAAREGTPAEVEHPGALDAAVANQRDVGRPTAHVDEDAPFSPGFLAGTRSGQRIRLSDSRRQLEVELSYHCLDRVDVSHRRERVEHGHLKVLTRKTNRVGDRVAVNAHVGDGRVHQARLQLAVAALHLEQVLRLAQGAALDHLQHR